MLQRNDIFCGSSTDQTPSFFVADCTEIILMKRYVGDDLGCKAEISLERYLSPRIDRDHCQYRILNDATPGAPFQSTGCTS
jgi:hypothetical protein